MSIIDDFGDIVDGLVKDLANVAGDIAGGVLDDGGDIVGDFMGSVFGTAGLGSIGNYIGEALDDAISFGGQVASLEEAAQEVRQHAEAMRKAESENAGRI
jgi:hypothetical protein